jgi:hypothetical protein
MQQTSITRWATAETFAEPRAVIAPAAPASQQFSHRESKEKPQTHSPIHLPNLTAPSNGLRANQTNRPKQARSDSRRLLHRTACTPAQRRAEHCEDPATGSARAGGLRAGPEGGDGAGGAARGPGRRGGGRVPPLASPAGGRRAGSRVKRWARMIWTATRTRAGRVQGRSGRAGAAGEPLRRRREAVALRRARSRLRVPAGGEGALVRPRRADAELPLLAQAGAPPPHPPTHGGTRTQ